VSAVAPFSLGAPAAGHAGGAPTALRHNAKEGEATADDSEIPAITKLLGRKFRIGAGPKCDPEARKYNHNFVRELPHRNDIGTLLQKMNLTGDGVERKSHKSARCSCTPCTPHVPTCTPCAPCTPQWVSSVHTIPR
jgi:hypothetical protein